MKKMNVDEEMSVNEENEKMSVDERE